MKQNNNRNDSKDALVSRRGLLGATAIAGILGASLSAVIYNHEEDSRSHGNPEDVSQLTIDDFGGGEIRGEWGNADNHATTDGVARTGSHSVYRVEGSSLYDDGTGFEDAFQKDGRFIAWSVYVDEMEEYTSFHQGFNGDGPPAPSNYSVLDLDVYNDEMSLQERLNGEIRVDEVVDADLSSGEWYDIIAWWGHETVECWVYDETNKEVTHLQADDHPSYGEHWWLFDEQDGDGAVFDDVRFYETHPYTGRHYTQAPEVKFERRDSDVVISPDGDDDSGDGSYDDPYYSPQAAFSDLDDTDDPAGSRVICRGGNYTLTSEQRVESSQGTRSEPIIMRPYADEEPVFDFSDASELRRGLYFDAADWWQVRDIEVREVPHTSEHEGRGILVSNSTNILLNGVESHHNTHDGLILRNTTDATIRWSSFHHNYDGGRGHADGIYVGEDSSDVLVEFCKLYHNFDDGIDFYPANPGNVVRYCIAWGNGYDPNMNTQDGWMAAYKMGGPESGGNLVHHCVAYDNVRGFVSNSSKHSNEYYNCTAYGCEEDNFNLDGNARETSGDEHEIRNCISHNGNVFSTDGSTDSNYNTWDRDIDDPKFLSTDSTDDEFLHLNADSPCIDAGTDVGLNYEGEAPDIGAFEHGAEWSLRNG